MKKPSLAFLVSFTALLFALTLVPASASDEDGSYRVAQADYEILVDERGRRFLVDPYTGEVIRRLDRERRLTRRERLRERRARRRQRLQRELDGLFGLRERPRSRRRNDYEDGVVINRPRRRDNGRYLDEYDQDGYRIEEPRRRKRAQPPAPRRKRGTVERKPLPAPTRKNKQDDQVASLPNDSKPVETASPFSTIRKPNFNRTQVASLQVFLDREGFSPGVIDGKWGSNVVKAVSAWQEAKGRRLDLNKEALDYYVNESGGDTLIDYTITQQDVAGPFVPRIPVDYGRKAQLDRLAYTSSLELLAEKFHMSQAYLRELNPVKSFNRAGTTIRVVAPGETAGRKVHYIVADKGRKQVRAFDRNGKLVSAYPATIGSASTPSPTGTHTIERTAVNPEYLYNPKKNFQQGKNDKILTIAPGPNGPVGSVWIALSKPTYGIHGTPNPETIGKTESHGCIRLTNWDALELVKLVSKGVTVEFVE